MFTGFAERNLLIVHAHGNPSIKSDISIHGAQNGTTCKHVQALFAIRLKSKTCKHVLTAARRYALMTLMMPPTKAEREAIRKFAASGGRARAEKLSKKRLREIAMMGVAARKAKKNGQ